MKQFDLKTLQSKEITDTDILRNILNENLTKATNELNTIKIVVNDSNSFEAKMKLRDKVLKIKQSLKLLK